MNNIHEGAMTLFLASIIPETTLTRYNIPKLHNKSIYTIKNDDNIDMVLDLDKNSHECLKVLVKDYYDYYLNQRLKDSELDNDENIYKYFCKIFNTENNYAREEGEELLKKYRNLCYYAFENEKNSSYLQAEKCCLDEYTYLLSLYAAAMTKNEDINKETLKTYLEQLEDIPNNLKEQLKEAPETSWISRNRKIENKEALEKDRAMTLTLALLSSNFNKELQLAKDLDNTLLLNMTPQTFNLRSKGCKLFFHDKEGGEKELEDFKNQFYDLVLTSKGFEDFTSKKLSQKEVLVYELMKENDKEFHKFIADDLIDSYTDIFSKINVGDNQTLLDSTLLNLTSFIGENPENNNLGKFIGDRTFEKFKEVCDKNYDIASKNHKLVPDLIFSNYNTNNDMREIDKELFQQLLEDIKDIKDSITSLADMNNEELDIDGYPMEDYPEDDENELDR